MTLPADVNMVDETGWVWTFLHEASDPDRVYPGALIVAGDPVEPFLARVVDIVDKTGPRFLKREIDAFLGQDRQTERDVGQRRRCRIRSKDGGRQLWVYDWRVFYPYYYTEEHREWDDFPDATARHHWTASWWKNGGI